MTPAEWFAGAIDLHVHSRPSIFPRLLSDKQVAEQAAAAGMRAVVLKAHEGSTVERAAVVAEALADPASGPAVYGGVVLNRFVGGLNPVAVELALNLGGKVVWLPTIHAGNHVSYYGKAGFAEQSAGYEARAIAPLSVLDADHKLSPAALEVLEVVAAHPGTILNNGHLNEAETSALFREAKRLGVERLMVAHPELPLSGYSLDFQLEMVALGAVIERCYLPHTERWGAFDFARTASEIARLGAEHCVLSTDLGQAAGPTPVEGLQRFGAALMEHGVSRADLEAMVKHNPAALLGMS